MYFVFALFYPSPALELGIGRLEERGFTGERLAVVVLERLAPKKQTLLDSMHSSDGMSLVDGLAMGASIGMLFGVIYGSVVFIGPVALGLIGMLAGGGAGYLLDRLVRRKKSAPAPSLPAGVIVAVCCRTEEEAVRAKEIIKEHQAVALGLSEGGFLFCQDQLHQPSH